MNAYGLSCLRGCQHASDLEERLNAERALSSDSDDVAIEESDAGLDISITGERAQQGHLFLSTARSSLLILWTGAEANSSDEDANIHGPTLSLTALPQPADPARAVVSYQADRVHLHLPYIGRGHSPKMDTLETSGGKLGETTPDSITDSSDCPGDVSKWSDNPRKDR